MSDAVLVDQMRRRARRMRAVNVPMRWVLRLPFPTPLSGSLMLLSFAGRKTGRIYRQPVSYVRDGDDLLTPGGGRWTLNLRPDQPVQIHLGGRTRSAVPEVVRDPGAVEPLLKKMTAANPRMASFVPMVGPDGQVDAARLEAAIGHGFCIVRWHLDAG